MNKSLTEASNIIESVATNHHQWANERGNNPRKLSGGKFEVDGVDLTMAKFDSLNKRFDKLEKANVNAIGASNIFCEICGAQGHISEDFQGGGLIATSLIGTIRIKLGKVVLNLKWDSPRYKSLNLKLSLKIL